MTFHKLKYKSKFKVSVTIRREVITNSVNLSFSLTLTLTFDLPTIDYALCIISKHNLASFPYLICFKKFDFGRTFQGQGEGHVWCSFS